MNDLKSGTGLLTFDSTPQDGAATSFDAKKGALSHTFGNKTDLTAYGIQAHSDTTSTLQKLTPG